MDTGASCSVISTNDYDILSKAQPASSMNKCHTKLRSYGGHSLAVKGKVTYTAEYKRRYCPVEVVVVGNRAPVLLGLETCIELVLMKRMNRAEEESKVMYEYKDVFLGHPARRVS